MRTIRFMAVAFGLSFAVASLSASAVDSTDLRAIHQQQLEYRDDALAGTGDFQTLDEVQRRNFVTRQDELFALIDGKSSLDELAAKEQVVAHNLLEDLQAILLSTEDLKMECEWTKKTGSHRKIKVCMTVAERRRLRDQAQSELHRSMGNGGGTNR